MTMLGRGRGAGTTSRDDTANNDADQTVDQTADQTVEQDADRTGAATEADEKARRAEEAARRAQELAEQARKAAEEARAALEEAERARAAGRAVVDSEAGEDGPVAARPKYALTKEDDRDDAEPSEPSDSAETVEDLEDVGTAEAGGADETTELVETVELAPFDGPAKYRADAAAEAEDTAAEKTVAEKTAVDRASDEAEEGDAPTVALSKEGEDGERPGDGEEDADEEGGAQGAAGGRRRRIVLRSGLGASGAVLLTLAVLLAVATGWLWYRHDRLTDAEKARKQVAFAAAQAAQDLSSYDYRTVDSDLRRAAAHTTGAFRDEFAKTTSQVKQNAARQQVVTEGIALKTGIEKVDGDRAVAIVFLNQETTKATSTQRLPSQYRLRLTMKRVGDRWLVEKLEVL